MKCKNVSIILLIFILTIVFYISCYILLKDLKEYKESDKSTEKLIEESIEIKEETQKRSIDWEYLKSINKDIIAWIEIENTKIDYPILKDKDVYYLKHTFDKKYNSNGSIFTTNSYPFEDKETIVYGHNMKNGSMFGKLKQMYESEKYKDSKYLWICTPNGKYRYEIFSMQYAKVGSDVYTLFSAHDEQFEAYVKKMAKQSKVDMKALGLGQDDYVVTLSTCTSDESVRFVVQARWVGTYK